MSCIPCRVLGSALMLGFEPCASRTVDGLALVRGGSARSGGPLHAALSCPSVTGALVGASLSSRSSQPTREGIEEAVLTLSRGQPEPFHPPGACQVRVR